MSDWKKLFKPVILERGKEYYDRGRVEILEKNNPIIHALVQGKYTYQVNIYRDGNHIEEMCCDCPYAEDGNNCKHMAAVLFALEDEPLTPGVTWRDALAQMPEADVRKLLMEVAESDTSVQKRILRMAGKSQSGPAQWQADLEDIIADYAERGGGWLDYEYAYDCMEEVANYLNDCLPPLLKGQRVMEAVELVLVVYDAAFSQDMEDPDGGRDIVSACCRDALDQILHLATPQQEQEIFDKLHRLMEQDDWLYGADDLEEMLMDLDWSEEIQQKELEWLDENLDSWRMSLRAKLMERMGATKAELIAWWEQYQDDYVAYASLLSLYEEEDLPKAIALVRKRREAEKSVCNVINQTQTLIRLLEKAGELKQYEEELRYLVLDLKCKGTQYLSMLKKVTSAQKWPAIFKKILADAKFPGDRMQLYSMEGMYSELFSELDQYLLIQNFESYEQELRGWDPDRTLELYVKILKKEMYSAGDRNRYRSIIWHLGKLKDYPRGQEEARKLADYWYQAHKNRPAMKDELKKSGYPQI